MNDDYDGSEPQPLGVCAGRIGNALNDAELDEVVATTDRAEDGVMSMMIVNSRIVCEAGIDRGV